MAWVEHIEKDLRNLEIASSRFSQLYQGCRVDLDQGERLVDFQTAVICFHELSFQVLEIDKQTLPGKKPGLWGLPIAGFQKDTRFISTLKTVSLFGKLGRAVGAIVGFPVETLQSC